MTVADVFVDIGKGRVDGLDQRGTVRVIQKPSTCAPVRYPSVLQDWDAAAQEFERRKDNRKRKHARSSIHKFPTIEEETDSSSDSDDESESPQSDLLVSSVEKENVRPLSRQLGSKPAVLEEDSQCRQVTAVMSSPRGPRLASEELGSPSPSRVVANTTGSASLEAATSKPGSNLKSDSAARWSTSRNHVDEGDDEVFEEDSSDDSSEGSGESEDSPHKIIHKQEEEGSSSEYETDETDEDESEDDDKPQGQRDIRVKDGNGDGDVVMNDHNPAPVTNTPNASDKRPSPLVVIGQSTAIETNTEKGLAADDPQSRKRKKSPEAAVPNKEPRLELSGGAGSSKGRIEQTQADAETANGDVSTDRLNPPQPQTQSRWSPRRPVRLPSFAETGRRRSFTELTSRPPTSKGIGLGITKSPRNRRSVMVNNSEDSAQSDGKLPTRRPLFNTPDFSSVGQTRPSLPDSTPSKSENPIFEKARMLHSALRKDSPADKERRSVSFAESDDILNPYFRPTTHTANKVATARATPTTKASPAPSSPGVGKESVDTNDSVPMDGHPNVAEQKRWRVTAQRLTSRERKAQEELACTELGRKIKSLENEYTDPEYLTRLRAVHDTWAQILKHERFKKREHTLKAKELKPVLEVERKKLQEYEFSKNIPLSLTPSNAPATPSTGKVSTESSSGGRTPSSQVSTLKERPSEGKVPPPVNGHAGSALQKEQAPISSQTHTPTGSQVKPASPQKKPTAAAAAVIPTPAAKSSPARLSTTSRGRSMARPDSTSDEVIDLEKTQLTVESKNGGNSESVYHEAFDIKLLSSSDDDDSADESSSRSDDEAEKRSAPEVSKADLLQRVKGLFTSSPLAKPSSPWQPQWQAVNTPNSSQRNKETLKSLKSHMHGSQKEKVEEAAEPKGPSTTEQPRKRNYFEVLSGSEASDVEDDSSESDSDSDVYTANTEKQNTNGNTNTLNKVKGSNSVTDPISINDDDNTDSSSDHGDILPSGSWSKLRNAMKR